MDGPGVYLAHIAKQMMGVLQELVRLQREQLELVRDLRDELVLQRRMRENGHAAATSEG